MDTVLYCPIPFLPKAYKTEILITSALESIGGWQFSASSSPGAQGLSYLSGWGKRDPVSSDWLMQGYINSDFLPQFEKNFKGYSSPSATHEMS